MTDPCSTRIRFFILALNTGDLLCEQNKKEDYYNITYAILAPITIFTVYIAIGTLYIGAIRNVYASKFLQAYFLAFCIFLEIFLATTVFQSEDLKPQPLLLYLRIIPLSIVILSAIDFVIVIATHVFTFEPADETPSAFELTNRNTQSKLEPL